MKDGFMCFEGFKRKAKVENHVNFVFYTENYDLTIKKLLILAVWIGKLAKDTKQYLNIYFYGETVNKVKL